MRSMNVNRIILNFAPRTGRLPDPDCARPRSPVGSKSLLGLSVAAFILAGLTGIAAICGWQPWPGALEGLWRESHAQEISGYVLLGICLLSLGFSLRKRWKRFGWGRLGIWRAGHALLGCATLPALAIHTGFQPGANLNQKLWLIFLGLVVFGGLAGMAAAREGPPGKAGMSHARRIIGALHIGAFGVLAVVTVFHILSVYYF
jgi:nitrite reductase (NADH) large subunit